MDFKRQLGLSQVIALALAIMGPTAAIAILPQIVIPLAGAATPLTFVIGAIAVGIIAMSFVGFSRRIATAGSVTAFVGEAFGPLAGFVAGWTLILNYLFFIPGSAASVAYFVFLAVGIFHPGLLAWGMVAVAAIVISVFGSLRDIAVLARIALMLELAAMLAITLLALLITIQMPFAAAAFVPSPAKGLSGLGAGVVLAITGFVGFEGAATLGREAREPLRAIPVAIAASIGVVALFFVLSSYAEVAAFGPDTSAALANADGPLAILAERFVGRGAGMLANVMGALSSLSVLLGLIPAASRMIYTVAAEVRVPWLERLSEHHGVPARASLIVGILGVAIGAGMVCLSPDITPLDLFSACATTATIAVILVYMGVTIGGMLDAVRRRRWLFCATGAAGALLLVWPLWSSIYPIPPWPADLFVPFVVLWLLAGVVLFSSRRSRSRRRLYDAST